MTSTAPEPLDESTRGAPALSVRLGRRSFARLNPTIGHESIVEVSILIGERIVSHSPLHLIRVARVIDFVQALGKCQVPHQ